MPITLPGLRFPGAQGWTTSRDRSANGPTPCTPTLRRSGSTGTHTPPLAGGSKGRARHFAAAEFGGYCVRRRRKLRIVRFRASARASLRYGSSPNRVRFAGLRFGFGARQGFSPHMTIVLNVLKIETAAHRSPPKGQNALRLKGFQPRWVLKNSLFRGKIGGNGNQCQRANCAQTIF